MPDRIDKTADDGMGDLLPYPFDETRSSDLAERRMTSAAWVERELPETAKPISRINFTEARVGRPYDESLARRGSRSGRRSDGECGSAWLGEVIEQVRAQLVAQCSAARVVPQVLAL